MKLRWVLILFVFSGSFVQAEEKTYIREYSYIASELDSKISARKNALDQAKSMLLEEIASYVHSQNELTQAAGDEHKKQFVQKVKSISAGFLGAKVLEEKWDGHTFWLRAEIRADSDKIKDELKLRLNQPQPVSALPVTSTDPMPVSPVYRTFVQQASLASALVLVTPIKIQMLQFYQMEGVWPTTFDQLGLKQSEMSDGEYLDQVKLGKDGEMILLLSKKFGKNKYLTLKPESIMGGMNIKWKCESNLQKIEMPRAMDCQTRE